MKARLAVLLTSFALAFASYAPGAERAVESVVPHVARLLSSAFTLMAATSVLAFPFQLNPERERAHRQIRLRVIAPAISVAGMTAFFAAEQLTGRNRVLYARRSQCWGLRTTSVGCGFALVYAAYKLFALVSIGLGPGLVAATAEVARRDTADTPEGDAEVEAAVIASAVDAKRAGLPLDGGEAPPAAGTRSSKGDLPAETAWLLLVADAYARRPAPENAGAAS
ncbi:DUF6545 domain-containing protein [Streptomyces sp. NBC_01443]|uniref:DUF6545 domain-containing protein n=1 Tax=Streptomyces sp. NBC_01443 TaxID=2903868 RepID=UPI0022507656|nr:DUF6545 domain-containing protein [Streptomyces sp. NBC_01443]MCX4625891.1 hypothetical protein [Streptomyces sp. NBC_01443]